MGADEENISRAFCRKRGLDPDTMVNVDGNGTMLPLWQVWTSDAALDAVSEAGKKVGWAEAERVACLDDVDEALREFATDPTGDNGTMIIREVMRALRARPAGGGEWHTDDCTERLAKARESLAMAGAKWAADLCNIEHAKAHDAAQEELEAAAIENYTLTQPQPQPAEAPAEWYKRLHTFANQLESAGHVTLANELDAIIRDTPPKAARR